VGSEQRGQHSSTLSCASHGTLWITLIGEVAPLGRMRRQGASLPANSVADPDAILLHPWCLGLDWNPQP
jgi:hypothetical protein